ncbi:hypothetical protein Ais01nite_09530 [Asanoa ishikariensis]|uniref:ABC-2 type transport system permease protein n=1 Tax=Asanoa ishikariensis TaxID=137265 RepID=A0A1H3T7Y4_9ACTN|nr:hypothetical protein [Asanoa ishikariensis]GIF62918.1 hypothetical protein Ais01nite_09530 [Asanoa ishikariensis]SDZ45988.1 hypothetical protein SAMN05421684_5278 [Asanoa ishikariensis]
MRLTIWLHEARRAGPAALLAPPAALLFAAAIAIFIRATDGSRDQAQTLLLAGLEAITPLAVAMVALTIVTRENCRELHLSLPTPHLATIGRRLGVLGAVTAVLCLAHTAAVAVAGYRTGPGGVASLLVWAAPTLWLAGFAALVATVTRSAVLASSAVALVWIGEQVWASVFVGSPLLRPLFLFFTSRVGDGPGWAANRVGLLAGGLLLLTVTAAVLSRPERLLSEEDA